MKARIDSEHSEDITLKVFALRERKAHRMIFSLRERVEYLHILG